MTKTSVRLLAKDNALDGEEMLLGRVVRWPGPKFRMFQVDPFGVFRFKFIYALR